MLLINHFHELPLHPNSKFQRTRKFSQKVCFSSLLLPEELHERKRSIGFSDGLVDPNLSKHSHVPHHFSHVIEKKERDKRVTAREIRLCLENRKRHGRRWKRLNRGFLNEREREREREATVHLVYPRVALITLRLPSVWVAAEAQLIIQRSRLLEWDRMYKVAGHFIPPWLDLNVAPTVYCSIMSAVDDVSRMCVCRSSENSRASYENLFDRRWID